MGLNPGLNQRCGQAVLPREERVAQVAAGIERMTIHWKQEGSSDEGLFRKRYPECCGCGAFA
jgi:hypothetical protein